MRRRGGVKPTHSNALEDIENKGRNAEGRKEIISLLPNSLINFKKAFAFTLAEVLITLGIIGVVAAMTIPTLVHKYQARVLEIRFKKAVSFISQLTQRVKYELQVENLYSYCYSYYRNSNDAVIFRNSDTCRTAINAAYMPFMTDNATLVHTASRLYTIDRRSEKIYTYNGNETTMLASCQNPVYYTNRMKDGTYFGYEIACGSVMFGVDVNGDAGPNRWGHDIFMFSISPRTGEVVGYSNGTAANTKSDDQAEEYYSTYTGSSKDYYQQTYGLPCNLDSARKGNGVGCTYYALKNKCPYDNSKTYWECLP